MARTKLYKLIIAALVIINAGMLVFFFTHKPPHHPPHHPPKSGDIAIELGFEGEKAKRVLTLEKEHHKRKRKLMEIDRKLHETLFSKINSDEDVSVIQDKIAANFVEIEKMTYDFFHEVTLECTPEQAKQLKKTLNHAFRQMRGPRK